MGGCAGARAAHRARRHERRGGGLTRRGQALTRSEEQQLVALTRSGDRAAADALLRSLDGLLRRAAWPYHDAGHGLGLGLDDYLQEARLEVVAACQGYDPERAALFRSYAMVRVRHRLYHVRRDALVAARREEEAAPYAAPADPAEPAEALDAARLDARVARALAAAVDGVKARDRRIVRARIVALHTGHEAATLREVGAEVGCSHQHVRDVEARALAGMRARLLGAAV